MTDVEVGGRRRLGRRDGKSARARKAAADRFVSGEPDDIFADLIGEKPVDSAVGADPSDDDPVARIRRAQEATLQLRKLNVETPTKLDQRSTPKPEADRVDDAEPSPRGRRDDTIMLKRVRPDQAGPGSGRRAGAAATKVQAEPRTPAAAKVRAGAEPGPTARPRTFSYKAGLAGVVGLAIWLVVVLVSPTTLVDTDNLPPDAGLSAVGTDPDVRGGAGDGDVGESGSGVAAESGLQTLAVGGDATDTTALDGEGDTTSTTSAEEAAATTGSLDYRSNLDMLLAAEVRNRNHDDSPYLNTPSAELTPSNHYGPRSEYLGNPGGNPEQSFPVGNGGQFRAGCEFSHFSYDDPLVFPGKPGASHLHMHFGNTHVNAFSTYDTLVNSGGSTCNGQELNRTGYWVPAMFDGDGNVRIPERVVVYYKGEGQSRGSSIVYPERAAMVMNDNVNTMPEGEGGLNGGKLSFVCSDNFSGASSPGSQTMPACDGSRFKNEYGVDDNPRVVLEMNVKFPQCWNGKDPGDYGNFRPPQGNWYGSNCTGEFNQNLPNLEYFVNYPVAIGENTADWFLSSDIDPTSFGASKATGGSTLHGDWWGGWHKETNQMWIDNCVNFRSGGASGCGFGYLTDGGPNGGAPADGPALKMRPQYGGPIKVPAEQLLKELCPDPDKIYSKPEDAAYCRPGEGL